MFFGLVPAWIYLKLIKNISKLLIMVLLRFFKILEWYSSTVSTTHHRTLLFFISVLFLKHVELILPCSNNWFIPDYVRMIYFEIFSNRLDLIDTFNCILDLYFGGRTVSHGNAETWGISLHVRVGTVGPTWEQRAVMKTQFAAWLHSRPDRPRPSPLSLAYMKISSC